MFGGQNIPTRKVSSGPLEYEVYKQNHSNIRRLKENLPQDLVANLAREVIRRVAEQDAKLIHIGVEPCTTELEELCTALISSDDSAATELLATTRFDGVGAEDIYLKHLAAAARMLGVWWENDRATFSQVTIGTGRMIAIMRGMRHHFEPTGPILKKSAIFASVPGEDHTLGVRMAAEIFRKDGWQISLKAGLDHDELVTQIEQEPCEIVGLSISGRHSIDALSRLVVAVHICSPHTAFLVSGQNVESLRPILTLMGIDAIASTIEEAKHRMADLLDRRVS